MKSSREWPIHTQTTSPAEHERLARERTFGAYQEGVEDRIWDALSAYEAARAAYRDDQGSAEALREAESELNRVYDEELERLEHASGLEPVEIARVRDWLGQRMHEGHSLEHDKEFAAYEGEVVALMEGVANLESYAELLERRGALHQTVREDLHDQLNRFYEQLEQLDARRADRRPSREREQLVALLRRIHDRYPLMEGSRFHRSPVFARCTEPCGRTMPLFNTSFRSSGGNRSGRALPCSQAWSDKPKTPATESCFAIRPA